MSNVQSFIIINIQNNKYKVVRKKVTNHKALPDKIDDFMHKLFTPLPAYIQQGKQIPHIFPLFMKRVVTVTEFISEGHGIFF